MAKKRGTPVMEYPQEPVEVCSCAYCGESIFVGDKISDIRENSEIVHRRCETNYAKDTLGIQRRKAKGADLDEE